MASAHFRLLSAQSRLLEKTFINFTYDPLGNYSKRNLLKGSAYIVLIHAELETYIESRIQELLALSRSRWKARKKATYPLLSLCSHFKTLGVSEQHTSKDKLGAHVEEAIKAAEGRIGKNHGIKERNVIPLLEAIGFEMANLDTVLIAELDALGSIRGDHAHKSARFHFRTKFDPFAIQRKVSSTLNLLAKFDDDLTAFRKKHFGH